MSALPSNQPTIPASGVVPITDQASHGLGPPTFTQNLQDKVVNVGIPVVSLGGNITGAAVVWTHPYVGLGLVAASTSLIAASALVPPVRRAWSRRKNRRGNAPGEEDFILIESNVNA